MNTLQTVFILKYKSNEKIFERDNEGKIMRFNILEVSAKQQWEN